MKKLLFVFLLLSIQMTALYAQSQQTRKPATGSDGKPGLPLPAMQFPDEVRRLHLSSPDTMRIREMHEIPSELPGKPVPAMIFPDDLQLKRDKGDDLLQKAREQYPAHGGAIEQGTAKESELKK